MLLLKSQPMTQGGNLYYLVKSESVCHTTLGQGFHHACHHSWPSVTSQGEAQYGVKLANPKGQVISGERQWTGNPIELAGLLSSPALFT